MLTVAFDESIISRIQFQLWYNRFKKEREDANENARIGRPSTSTADENIEAEKKMILDNTRITIREGSDGVCRSVGTGQAIFMDVLGMKRAAAKTVQNF